MKAYDFEGAVWNDEVYCLDCLPVDPEDEEVQPIFAGSEWESYPTCCECGAEMDYVVLLDSDGAPAEMEGDEDEEDLDDFGDYDPEGIEDDEE